jgi:hypothetical protein
MKNTYAALTLALVPLLASCQTSNPTQIIAPVKSNSRAYVPCASLEQLDYAYDDEPDSAENKIDTMETVQQLRRQNAVIAANCKK